MATSAAAKLRTPAGGGKKAGKNGAFIPTLVVLALILAAVVFLSEFWTEVQWFKQINALRVFWTQYGAALLVGLVGTLIAALVFALNIRITLGKKPQSEAGAEVVLKPRPQDTYLKVLRSHSWLTYGVIPLVLGLIIGGRLGFSWRTVLLWLHGSSFGTKDPEFGLDVSFFVFTLPALHLILSFLITLLIACVILGVIGYWLTASLPEKNTRVRLPKRIQMHLAVLSVFFAFVIAAQFWLARYDLLLGNNQRFSGANFTAINASKPGYTILAISVFLIGILLIVAAVKQLWKPALVGVAATVTAALVLSVVYPLLVQNFKVNPNAVELESKYIQRNIDATLAAYGLENVESQQYAARTDTKSGQLRHDSETAAQIRLLDPTIVAPSFNQLQQNRQYYEFLNPLAVDRYAINGKMRDTVVAMRELNLDGLDNSRRSWVNDHTVYTHGFGVAAAYGNTMTTKGDPTFWEAGIPSAGEMGDYESRVYFGKKSPSYSIVGAPEGSDPWELDYPDDKAPNGQVNTTYKGNGGPKISNVFDKLLYAVKFRSTELFFSDRVTSESQILFDRDPHKRLSKVAPYLTLDSKAVPAVVDMDDNPDTPKELVWIIDGYTTSNNYPYSARETLAEATMDSRTRQVSSTAPEEINYIRNSVKAVVNAYDGSVKLFQWDQDDPIINAWKGIFPGQITPLAKMPGDLIAHVRYPEDLFKVQRTLLARYHVKDAKSFYSGGDFWQVPREPTMAVKENTPAQPPYYMTLQMPGQDAASFSITTSYIPGGNTNRNVMTGFLAADSNAGNETGKIADSYGKLRLLEAPRDLTVSGPGQAENTMLTNPDVSTALNLLRQGGTEVLEGNLLSLPIGGGLLYVQPIYVQASSGTQYPTLQYVLALFGDQVGFAPTLDEALDKVFGGDSGAKAGDAAIAGAKDAPVAGGNKQGKEAAKPAEGGAAPAPAPAAGTPEQRLAKALQDARSAIQESETARKNGDWAAYGSAQAKLAKAIEDANAAQAETKK